MRGFKMMASYIFNGFSDVLDTGDNSSDVFELFDDR